MQLMYVNLISHLSSTEELGGYPQMISMHICVRVYVNVCVCVCVDSIHQLPTPLTVNQWAMSLQWAKEL